MLGQVVTVGDRGVITVARGVVAVSTAATHPYLHSRILGLCPDGALCDRLEYAFDSRSKDALVCREEGAADCQPGRPGSVEGRGLLGQLFQDRCVVAVDHGGVVAALELPHPPV